MAKAERPEDAGSQAQRKQLIRRGEGGPWLTQRVLSKGHVAHIDAVRNIPKVWDQTRSFREVADEELFSTQ